MAYWPKTLRGNVLTVLLIVVGLPIAVIVVIALSGPLVWGGLALVAIRLTVVLVIAPSSFGQSVMRWFA